MAAISVDSDGVAAGFVLQWPTGLQWPADPAVALVLAVAALVPTALVLLGLGWRGLRRRTDQGPRAAAMREAASVSPTQGSTPSAAADPGALREVADRLSQIVWVTDTRLTEVRYVSAAFESVWGRPRSALYRDVRSLLRAVPPADRMRLYEAGEAMRQGAERLDIECRIRRPDGELRWIRARGARLDAHHDAAGSIGGIVEDVTDRKWLETTEHFLSEAGQVLGSTLDREDMLKAVANLAVESIAEYCILYLAEETDRIRRVEFAHADPAKAPVIRELLDEYDAELDALLRRVVRRREPLLRSDVPDSLLRRLCRDDRHVELTRRLDPRSFLVAPLVLRERVLGVIVLVSGRTGRRYGPGDRVFAGELANRIALALDNARLYHAAVAASQAKSDFLAVVGHELRTPLTAIMGYTDLLKNEVSGPLNEKQGRQLGSIDQASHQLARLIDEILTFSRLGSGRETLQSEVVDLVGFVREVVEPVEQRAREKGLDVCVDLPDRPIRMETDPTSLRHILRSLLSNAVKFTESGGIGLRVRIERPEIVFAVRDTGIGIPDERRELIFAPFWQVESATIREAGGAGLGLSIARRVTRLLGGDIEVESEPGRGSTFTVRIPLRTWEASGAADI